MGVGSLVLWIGLPIGVLWALSKMTESSTHHFVAALIAVPAAMALFAPALFWLNGLYLRVIGASGRKRTTRLTAGASVVRWSSSSTHRWRSPSQR